MRIDEIRDTNGKLPAFAWPGGYPVFYVMGDGEALCAPCANGENGSEAVTQGADGMSDKSWTIVGYDVNYEDAHLFCAHCNARIESAYAEDEGKDNA